MTGSSWNVLPAVRSATQTVDGQRAVLLVSRANGSSGGVISCELLASMSGNLRAGQEKCGLAGQTSETFSQAISRCSVTPTTTRGGGIRIISPFSNRTPGAVLCQFY